MKKAKGGKKRSKDSNIEKKSLSKQEKAPAMSNYKNQNAELEFSFDEDEPEEFQVQQTLEEPLKEPLTEAIDEPLNVITPQALKKGRKLLKKSNITVSVNLTRKELFDDFKVKEYYPLEKIKNIFTLKDHDQTIHSLDFTGIDQLSDAFFYMVYKVHGNSIVCSQVRSIKLVGCVHITDRGVQWMASTFSNLEEVYLNGCPKVTERGLTHLLMNCTRLTVAQVRVTDVGFICFPPKMLVNIHTEGSSLISPHFNVLVPDAGGKVFSKGDFFTTLQQSQTYETYKCLFVLPDGWKKSVIGDLFGSGNMSAPLFGNSIKGFKHGRKTFNITECFTSSLHLFLCNRSVVILTYDSALSIELNLASLQGLITAVLSKAPHCKIAVLGLKTAGIVSQAACVSGGLNETLTAEIAKARKHTWGEINTNLFIKQKPMQFDAQTRVADFVQYLESIEKFGFDLIETWESGKDPVIFDKMSEMADKIDVMLPEYNRLSAAICEVLNQVEKASSVQKEQDFIAKLKKKYKGEFGAVGNVYKKLIKVMKITGIIDLYMLGDEVYIVTHHAWFYGFVNTCVKFVNDHAPEVEGLGARDQKALLMMLLMKIDTMKAAEKEALPFVVDFLLDCNLVSANGHQVLSLNSLPEEPPYSLVDFLSNDVEDDVCTLVYTYNFPSAVPKATLQLLLFSVTKRVTQQQTTSFAWKNGVVIQEPPLVIFVKVNEGNFNNLASSIDLQVQMYIDPQSPAEKNMNNFLWMALENYRLPLEAKIQDLALYYTLCITKDGIVLDGKQEIAQGFPGNHLMTSKIDDQLSCSTCQLKIQDVVSLWRMQASLLPAFGLLTNPRIDGSIQRKGNWFTTSADPCTVFGTTMFFTESSCFSVTFPQGIACGYTVGVKDNVEILSFSEKKGDVSLAAKTIELKVIEGSDIALFKDGEEIGRKQIKDVFSDIDDPVSEVYARRILLRPFIQTHSQATFIMNEYSASRSGNSVSGEWEKGMRLEALDRLNPSLICVATIDDIQDGKLLIHFDGWTARYDYWTEPESADLHPIGYMAQKGQQFRGETNLQAPKGYSGYFTWDKYLVEMKVPPAPFELFNEAQVAGIKPYEFEAEAVETLSSFGISVGSGYVCRGVKKTPYQAMETIKRQFVDYKIEEKLPKVLSIYPPSVLVPQNLSKNDLKMMPVKRCWQWSSMALQFLCNSDGDWHLVDAPGVPYTSANLMQNIRHLAPAFLYFYLKKTPTNSGPTLPKIIKNAVSGVASISSDEIEKQLNAFYLTMAMVMSTLNAVDSDFKLHKTKQVYGELWTNAKKNDSLGSHFDVGEGSDHLPVCVAHHSTSLPSHELAAIPMEKFTNYSHIITTLDFSSNSIAEIPDNFFSFFPRLISLNLTSNNLTSLPNGIRYSFEIEELYLSYNKLTELPSDFEDAASTLTDLHISNNPLYDLPAFVSKCINLEELKASEIGLTSFPEKVTHLSKLKVLYLGGNAISSVPADLKKLSILEKLDLSGVKWFDATETKVNLLSKSALSDFLDKNPLTAKLTQKERQDIFQHCDEGKKGALESKGIQLFNNLLFKKFPRFGAGGEKDPYVSTGGFPPAVFSLKYLTELDLSYHSFTKAPMDFKALSDIVKLNLSSNPLLEGIGDIGAPAHLKELRVRNCPSLKTPPKEIVARGFQAIYSYLLRLQSGSVSCKRTKLMMVGLGGAGKTSLVKALRGDHHLNQGGDMGEDITDGIDICDWTISHDDQSVTFSVWDFAGQVVYYNTHQFFLSNRAVYLLLWNIRLGHEHAGLEFWLSSIACHAPKAPIIIVGSHKDQVQKFWIPEAELGKKYPQIKGFHAISCYTGDGIDKLRTHLLEVTLKEEYMGERIPQAWLQFETSMTEMKRKKVLKWEEIEGVAVDNGIYEPSEISQAVQFLHNLGSVQHFQNNVLRTHVVIDPQWIVDAMACVVSVNDSPIEDGIFKHKDIARVWRTFETDMHHWLLRLTEEFDLTFPSKDNQSNIVPCLLQNTDTKFHLPDISDVPLHKRTKLLYKFDYLPTGLFNRAQVRLYQFSETASIWKKGSLLKKNGHSALLNQPSSGQILVTVQGPRPDNILFMVHEVLETLIQESFHGVSYDYFVPCSDCIKEGTSDPCMFPASQVKRATELKAPFLQCDKFFHTLSLTELHAVMPPSSSHDFDVHLERSLRDLDNLSDDLSHDVFMIYSSDNIPKSNSQVHPRKICEDLQAAGLKVWFSLDPAQIIIKQLAVTIRESKLVLFCLSNEFVKSDHYHQLWQFCVNNMQKTVQYVILGSGWEWKDSVIGSQIAAEVFVNMMDKSRYEHKIKELVSTLNGKLSSNVDASSAPECFISYCWRNSHDAVARGTKSSPECLGWGDPRKFKEFLQSKGVSCWMDIERVSQGSLFEEIAGGLKHAKVVVACVSDDYVKSRNCQLEFRFANIALRLPMIMAVVGTGETWKASEIGMLSLGAPEVNLQYESPDAFDRLLKQVKAHIPEEKPKEEEGARPATPSVEENNQLAFQELLELAQRKLLRQLGSYTESLGMAPYPRLFILDYLRDEEKNLLAEEQIREKREEEKRIKEEIEKKRKEAEEEERKLSEKEGGGAKEGTEARKEEKKEKEESRPSSARPSSARPSSAKPTPRPQLKRKGASKLQSIVNALGAAKFLHAGGVSKDIVQYEHCIRFMCEHEEGWHETDSYLVLQPQSGHEWEEFLASIAPYMARVLAVLKRSSLSLPIFTDKKGSELRKALEEKCGTESEYHKEYLQFRNIVIEKDEDRQLGGLARCHLPNGKNLWLCSKHRSAERITVLSEDVGEVTATAPETENFLQATPTNSEPPTKSNAAATFGAVTRVLSKKASVGKEKEAMVAAGVVAENPKSKACSVM